MLPVDVISAYIICGAGCLIGAGMMALARPSDALTRGALRLCSLAFVVVGLALLQFIVGAASPGRWTLLAAWKAR
jgi:hypothetical protein